MREEGVSQGDTDPAEAGDSVEQAGNSPHMWIKLLRQSREVNLALPHSLQVPEPSDYREDKVQICIFALLNVFKKHQNS